MSSLPTSVPSANGAYSRPVTRPRTLSSASGKYAAGVIADIDMKPSTLPRKRTVSTASAKGAAFDGGSMPSTLRRRPKPRIPLKKRILDFFTAVKTYDLESTRPLLYFRRLALVAYTYNFFYLTLCIAWTCKLMTIPALVLAYLSDAIMLVDTLIPCFLRREEKFGIQETNFIHLSERHLVYRAGLIRFLCALPWDVYFIARFLSTDSSCQDVFLYWDGDMFVRRMDDVTIWSFVRLVKFIPMVTLLQAFLSFQIRNIPVQVTALIKNLLAFLLFSHISACAFWVVSIMTESPKSWVQQFDLVPNSRNDTMMPLGTQYLTSLLTAEKAMVFNSRYSNTDAESLYAVIETLVAALIYGSIFGNIATIVRYLDKEQTAHHEGMTHHENVIIEKHHLHKLKSIKNYMNDKHIPAELQDKVLAYHKHKFTHTLGLDESSVFDGIPRVLKQDIANYLYYELVSKVPFLQGADRAFIETIANAVIPLTVLSGFYIFRKDDDGQEMYFICKGSVDIINEKGDTLVTLRKGQFFGEIAVMDGCKRTASAKAIEDTELCYLRKCDFDELLGENARRILTEAANKIKERERMQRMEAEAAGMQVPEFDEQMAPNEEELLQHVDKDQQFMVNLLQQKRRSTLTGLGNLLDSQNPLLSRRASANSPGGLFAASRSPLGGSMNSLVLSSNPLPKLDPEKLHDLDKEATKNMLANIRVELFKLDEAKISALEQIEMLERHLKHLDTTAHIMEDAEKKEMDIFVRQLVNPVSIVVSAVSDVTEESLHNDLILPTVSSLNVVQHENYDGDMDIPVVIVHDSTDKILTDSESSVNTSN